MAKLQADSLLVLQLLAEKPRTSAELQDALYDSAIGITQRMRRLMNSGYANRVDGRSGKGWRAVYGIAPRGALRIEGTSHAQS